MRIKSRLFIVVMVALVILIAGFFILYFRLNNKKSIGLQGNSLQAENTQLIDFLNSKKKLPQKSEEVSLVAVGDVSFSRGVERVVKSRNDINFPLLRIQGYLRSGDIVFGNLETPITEGREISDLEM
ncbi:MAG: CapA family protein, partial [Minisyncoccia bacterium]